MFNSNLRISFLIIRKLTIFVLITSLFVFSTSLVSAQTDSTETQVAKPVKFDPLVDNILDKLPPLQILIDSAVNHAPQLRITNADISIMKYRINDAKIWITRNIGITGELATGNLYQFSTNQSSGSTPNEFINDRFEYYYGFGIALRMPLYDLLNRKNQINMAKRELEKNMLLKEEKSIDIRKEVIIIYQDLLMRQELLKIKNESQLTTRLQVQMAEMEFKNGNIKIADLSRIVESNARNIYDYTQEKFLFYRQYLILEELVGMKFNLINEIE